MDQEGPTLKQCGQATISIFPPHPRHEVLLLGDQLFDPNKEGFKKELGVYVKPRKVKDNVTGYEICNMLEDRLELHEAQNLGDYMSEMLRSIQLTSRNVLTGIARLHREMTKEKK